MSDILMFSRNLFMTSSKRGRLFPEMQEESSLSYHQLNHFGLNERPEMYTNLGFNERDAAGEQQQQQQAQQPQPHQSRVMDSESFFVEAFFHGVNNNNTKAQIQQQQQQPFLRFEIADHGIGIDEDAMKSLFHPFQKAQRLTGGTGTQYFSF